MQESKDIQDPLILSVRQPEQIKTKKFSYRNRYLVFMYIIILNIFTNFDQGFLPAATEEFKKDFDQDGAWLLGIFGSVVYFGNLLGKHYKLTIGSMFVMSIIDKYNRKPLLMVFIILDACFLFAFPLYLHALYGIGDRILTGLTQVSVSFNITIRLLCQYFLRFGLISMAHLMGRL
jgi:hypothetical protein